MEIVVGQPETQELSAVPQGYAFRHNDTYYIKGESAVNMEDESFNCTNLVDGTIAPLLAVAHVVVLPNAKVNTGTL